MFWIKSKYLDWIKQGCPVDDTIVQLCLSSENITTIPTAIMNLHNINKLYLSDNQLTTIPAEIGNLHNLETLFLYNNRITTLPVEIGNLHNLRDLFLSNNKLTTLTAGICNLHNLEKLYLSNNQLTILPENIGNLHNIQTLYIDGNQFTNIPAAIGNLHNLRVLILYNNRLEYIPPNIRRFLDNQRHTQGVYNDAQSVHNSTVQQTIKSSILCIISITPTIVPADVLSYIISDKTLSAFTKQSLVEYSRNTDLISDLNVTFLEVLIAVWNRIAINAYSTDIKNVLNDEMSDAECKCFTGRVSRLVNCLSGFDALVEVKISDNEQIGNVIAAIGDRLKANHQYTPELHKEIARVELKEMRYKKEVIDAWINYIE